jgi:hypothetical protein
MAAATHLHTHTQISSAFAYGVFTFLWVYFESQTLFVRSLTIGNTHHHQQKRRKSAVMSASGNKFQIEKLILQNSLLCKLRNANDERLQRDVGLEILIDTKFNYKILVSLVFDNKIFDGLRHKINSISHSVAMKS